MTDTPTRVPLRADWDLGALFDGEECEVVVMDGPQADDDDSGLLPPVALERLEAWASAHRPPAADLDRLDRLASSATVDECVRRFAASEADLSDPTLDGLGRVSGARVARLGGLLHGRVAYGSAEPIVRTAVEQTIRAGYFAAVLTHQVSAVPVHDLTVDELWHALLRLSYRIPRDIVATTWELCGLDEVWVEVLQQLGLEREANHMVAGVHTSLSRSIRGLAAVGVALAVAERGGRRDRREGPGRRRRTRPDRLWGTVPPAPRGTALD